MLTTLRLLVAKAPTWAWWLVVGLLIAGLLFLAGVRHEATRIHRKTLGDSVVVQRAVIDTAAKRSAMAIIDANVHEKKAAPLRDRARAAVADTSNHVPASVIAVVDSALTEDAVTIAKKDTAIVAQTTEIVARIQLDTLTEHQVSFKPPDDGIGIREIAHGTVIVAEVVAVGYGVVRLGRWLIRVVH